LKNSEHNSWKPRNGEKKNNSKYQPFASVEAFLKVCKEVGLQDLDVFNPSDVVDKKDIRHVCVCLRRLSKNGRSLGIQDTLVTLARCPETLCQDAGVSVEITLSIVK
jgi:hypothetical protein